MNIHYLDWVDEKIRPHFWNKLFLALGEPAFDKTDQDDNDNDKNDNVFDDIEHQLADNNVIYDNDLDHIVRRISEEPLMDNDQLECV